MRVRAVLVSIFVFALALSVLTSAFAGVAVASDHNNSTSTIHTEGAPSTENATVTNSNNSSAPQNDSNIVTRSISAATGIDLDDYTPDTETYPNNGFRVFFSGDQDNQTMENITEEQYNETMEIMENGTRSDLLDAQAHNPAHWAKYYDFAMPTVTGSTEIYGYTWSEYQQNQFEAWDWEKDTTFILAGGYQNRVTDSEHNYTDYTQVPWTYNPEPVIRDAYAAVSGAKPGGQMHVRGATRNAKSDWTIYENGEVQGYLDFWLDSSNLPDDVNRDRINNTDSDDIPWYVNTTDPSYTVPDWGSGVRYQHQERDTWQIEWYNTDGALVQYMFNHTSGEEEAGQHLETTHEGVSTALYDHQDSAIDNKTLLPKFKHSALIEAVVTRNDDYRVRQRGYNSRDVTVSDSKDFTLNGSSTHTVTINNPDGEAGWECREDVSGSDSVSAVKTWDDTNTWYWETAVSRTYSYSHTFNSKTVDTSGSICRSFNENETSKTVTDTVSGSETFTASDSKNVTVKYEWWKPWHSWIEYNEENVQKDEIEVSDTFEAEVMTENNITINQTAIEIGQTAEDAENPQESGSTYLLAVSINQGGNKTVVDASDGISDEEFYDSFIWGRAHFGDQNDNLGFVESDWKAYSQGRTPHDGQVDETELGYYNYYFNESTHDGANKPGNLPFDVTEERPVIPEVYIYSEGDGLNVEVPSSSQEGDLAEEYGSQRSPEIMGINRSNVQMTADETADPVKLNSSEPYIYTDFMIKNVPAPIGDLEGLYGETLEPSDQNYELNTNTLQYREPDVNMNYNRDSGSLDIYVDGPNGGLANRQIEVSTKFNNYGTHTTDSSGHTYIDIGKNRDYTQVTVTVHGDSMDVIVNDAADRNYYIAGVKATQMVGSSAALQLLKQLVWAVPVAIPIILWYYLWREMGIGK